MRIFKHQISQGKTLIECAQVLSVIEQRGMLTVYVLDDPAHNRQHKIRVVGTGLGIDFNLSRYSFLGTANCDPYVWHVFYRDLTKRSV